VIEVRELSKYYGESKAVGPLDFTIQKGQVIGLLGLNGAGKTTTLRMLSSELLPTSGRVLVDGVDLAEEPDKVRARIGYLPDRPPLYGEMRVREFLEFAGRLRGMPSSGLDKRIDEVLELTSLKKRADDRIDTLSHGFKQRVGIAQAIVHKPALLLLDEPISGLDPVQIVEMRELIRSLRGEHTTVLSSHILSEISETCDRVLVIVDGQIVTDGTEEELAERMTPGFDVRVVVRGEDAKTRELAESVEGVRHAKRLSGKDVAAEYRSDAGLVVLHVSAERDVREALCRRLVTEGLGVLEVMRSEPELESIFLQLAGAKSGRNAEDAREGSET
jgi:ABC-2 type transport system ATP-binding protein